jgi:hypothetical protein
MEENPLCWVRVSLSLGKFSDVSLKIFGIQIITELRPEFPSLINILITYLIKVDDPQKTQQEKMR